MNGEKARTPFLLQYKKIRKALLLPLLWLKIKGREVRRRGDVFNRRFRRRGFIPQGVPRGTGNRTEE